MGSIAMPAHATRFVERVSYACLALILAVLTYGILQPVPMNLWGARILPDVPLPTAILIVLGGTPLVLEAGLLLTGSLERKRAWRVGGAIVLFVIATILSPHTFFQSLPDALVNPFVFHLITELALLSIVGSLCLVAPRVIWWAMGLVVIHAAVALYVAEISYSASGFPPPWILARDLTLLAALVGLAWTFARGAAVNLPRKSRA